MSASDYRMAIDVGGTFTDFVVAGAGLGERTYKVSSTPDDPTVGVVNGLGIIAADLGHDIGQLLAQTPVIVHGTTITTNALLTGTGAHTAQLATDGFADVLLLRQGHRDNQWDSKSPQPTPLVPRERIRTVRGRIDRQGREIVPLADEDVAEAAQAFRADGVEAVGVSLMFSFLNSAHERRVGELLAKELPDVFISLSHEVAPQIRLYERTSTTIVNAYVGPVLRRYIARLRHRLGELGHHGALQVMQSNGGLAGADTLLQQAVTTLLSGPAGGPIASARYLAPVGVPKTMTIDMGGTSFEASIARGGKTEVRVHGGLAGHALVTPMLDISTIGAGGGSLAWLDSGGMLRVGPQSAGAVPGPACYGRGGTRPTVTDANLVLGYIAAAGFGGGELALDVTAAEDAITGLADALGLGLQETAAGIVTTVNAAMADSLRLITLHRGTDAREFALVAAGGAGPLHAVALAADLEIPLVVVPRDASVLCASGILVTDFKHNYVRTVYGRGLDPDDMERVFAGIERIAADQLTAEGVAAEEMRFDRVAEVRYLGQIHTIDLLIPPGSISDSTFGELRQQFHPAHHQRFGHSLVDDHIEIVNIRVEARGTAAPPESPQGAANRTSDPRGVARERPAWFDGNFIPTRVQAAGDLDAGSRLTGPAMVELTTSTVVVPPGWTLEVHSSGSLLLHPSARSLDGVVDELLAGGTSV